MKFVKSRPILLALTILICRLMVANLGWKSVPHISSTKVSSKATSGQDVDVGRDEPSVLFYSKKPGSGNQMRYEVTLPSDPPSSNPTAPRKSYSFELHPAFWFGMAVCDTQSYPEQSSTCLPDSDKNIVDPAISPRHPGTAYMEVQFYAPGWIQWPAGNSCNMTKWCAALIIESLSENPVTGQINNTTCQSNAGLEYVNFAFVTKNGIPRFGGPPNPIQSNAFTFTPDPSVDMFMNPGDQIMVTMHDTPNGLTVILNDNTSGQRGSMTASAANRFGQVQFDPMGKSCNYIPYNFHPMYSTSSEMTRVPWANHSYNIAFAAEIGRFDFCSGLNASVPGNSCPRGSTEGLKSDTEPTDGDDTNCFSASTSLLVSVSGCIGANTGFDGASYQPLWPDGNTALHPTSILFTSPLTGSGYNVNYTRVAFETDLPRLESTSDQCDTSTGQGCTLIPNTDDGDPASFYPFFSTRNRNGSCVWQLGNQIPGSTNDFHQNQQYGTLLNLTYTGLRGTPIMRYNDFRQVFSSNPCNA